MQFNFKPARFCNALIFHIYIKSIFQILLYLTSFYFGMFMILEIGLIIFKVKCFLNIWHILVCSWMILIHQSQILGNVFAVRQIWLVDWRDHPSIARCTWIFQTTWRTERKSHTSPGEDQSGSFLRTNSAICNCSHLFRSLAKLCA